MRACAQCGAAFEPKRREQIRCSVACVGAFKSERCADLGRTLDRIMEQVVVDPSGCWLWTGKLWLEGYARAYSAALNEVRAHRIVYRIAVGPIPEGYVIDHTCHNADTSCPGGSSCPHRRCLNPAHLEAATDRTNILRGRSVQALNAVKTHCAHGHEFTLANTYITTRGARSCRQCARRHCANYRLRRAAA